MTNLKVFTAFSGYDSQCMALDRLHRHNPDFNYELVGWAEIDKHAIAAHNAVYPQWADRNYGDISKIDWSQVPDFDLFTYSSPCQDFSQAGKQAGGTEGSGTRSSLLWECRRAILAKKPKYLLMENVAALVSQKFIRLFNAWQLELERYGYRNFAKVLNAKDYGVPQNRERIFMVSVLDEQARYEFPDPMPLQLRLKDVLEPKVDERYYLRDTKLGEVEKSITSEPRVQVVADLAPNNQWQGVTRQQNHVIAAEGISMAITAEHARHESKIAEPQVLGWSRSGNDKGEVIKRHPVQVANCVTSGKRDNTQNYVMEPQVLTPKRTEYGKAVRKQYEAGELQEQRKNLAQLEPREDGICNTLTSVQKDNLVCECSYRIRKLTERECFRLMDVPEAYIDRIQQAGISRSQQYKMAGNSIVVSCMYHIWRRLWIDTHITTLTLF